MFQGDEMSYGATQRVELRENEKGFVSSECLVAGIKEGESKEEGNTV